MSSFLCLFSCFVCLLSILCILCFCTVLCIVSPFIQRCLLSLYKITDRCHRVEAQLQ